MRQKGHSLDDLLGEAARGGATYTTTARRPAALAAWWPKTYEARGTATPTDPRMRAVAQAHPGSARQAAAGRRQAASSRPATKPARPVRTRRNETRERD